VLQSRVRASGYDHQLARLARSLVEALGVLAGDLGVTLGMQRDQRPTCDQLDRLADIVSREPGLEIDRVFDAHLEPPLPDAGSPAVG